MGHRHPHLRGRRERPNFTLRWTSFHDGAADDLLGLSGAVAGQFLAAFNRLNNVHAFAYRSEDRMVPVEPWCGDGGEEKLRATGVSASVGHGENTRLVVLQGEGRWFARDLPTWSAGTCSSRHWVLGMRAATLNHEILNHTVEMEPVVVAHFDKFNEIGDGVGGTAVKEVDGDVACAGFHENLHVPTTKRHLKRICLRCEEPHLDN